MVLTNKQIVLASGSRYRRELLARLGLPFESWSPNVDERALAGESPRQSAERLSRSKADAAARRWPQALIIGSDQVADLGGEAIGKPGTLENARAQLARLSGREVLFHTGLCLLDASSGQAQSCVVTTDVVFRTLGGAEIDAYLAREPALDCAGSAKSEGLGIALLDRLGGDDPTALVGLPLIALARMLRNAGVAVP
ncbi:MAG TPA: Maf family nucleotide pyrophosphatase [Usitatibacter sp.]|nr:Maf family nucleotide pyrophosphatase [Usitatibacter sp.]